MIYTITCSNAYNYGAVLQTYALQKYLERLGHNVKVINYTPPYLREISPKYKKNILAQIIRKILYTPDYYKSSIVFNSFKEQYIHQTSACTNLSDVQKLPKPDLYIAGSDQIWNPYMNNGLDETYYINIPHINKISYAASIGCNILEDSYNSFLKKMLLNFKFIYVREKQSAAYLQKLGINADYTLDPVYLLTSDQWNTLCDYNPKEKYIIVYALHHIQNIYNYAKNLADSLGVKMYVISVEIKEIRRGGDKFFWNPTVQQFLSLIRNAEAVVSNSFHGISFGLIFNRPVHIFDTEDNDIRISNIIDLFSLKDRLCNIKDINNVKNNVSNTLSNIKIEMEVARSKKILNQSIYDYK